MNSRDLLSKLSVLESLLHDFSYEELGSREASYLKKSFESFKNDLEKLVDGQSIFLTAEEDNQASAVVDLSNPHEQDNELPHLAKLPKPNAGNNMGLIGDLKILVFEDNALSQRLIALQLTQCGCTAFVTDSAQVGLEILENNQIDVVLMDLHMPLMSGFEVAGLIRESEIERIANIPIIALSADISLRDEEKCRNNGIIDFVLKPYTIEALILKLAKHTNRNKTQSLTPEASSNLFLTKKIDIRPLLEDCEGDFEVLENLVVLFKQNSIEFMEAANRAVKHSDFSMLKFAAHKIKNGLAMLGAKGLLEIVQQIHDGCSTETAFEKLKVLSDKYANKYTEVEKELEKQVIELRRG